MRSLAISSGSLVLAAAGGAVAQTPGFWLVGAAPGHETSSTQALSRDGSIAAGYSYHFAFPSTLPGFTWTREGGRYDFGLEPGMPLYSAAYGLTNDGATIVGRMATLTQDRAYRRVGGGPLQDLGTGGYQYSAASGVSGDGAVVAVNGTSTVQGIPTGQAFRWTQASGLQPLGWLHGNGRLSQANGVSRDGSAIVGQSAAGAASEAFVWRESTGMQPLMPPSGWSSLNSFAYSANASGEVIVGSAMAPNGFDHLVRWTPFGPQDLGPGSGSSVSDDGNVIGMFGGWIWTPGTGELPLSDYLAFFGVSTPADWSIRNVYAVSGDGMTFAGEAFSTAGVSQGFVATVPAPSGAVILLLPALLCRRRRA